MTKKNYKTQNYYECPVCMYTWTELYEEDVPDMCPCCDKENVEPFKSYKNVLEWTDHYTAIPNHIHPNEGNRFEFYGEDWEYIQAQDSNHVWTVVEDDHGELSIIKGIHWVNRLFYVVSKESHENDNENYYW